MHASIVRNKFIAFTTEFNVILSRSRSNFFFAFNWKINYYFYKTLIILSTKYLIDKTEHDAFFFIIRANYLRDKSVIFLTSKWFKKHFFPASKIIIQKQICYTSCIPICDKFLNKNRLYKDFEVSIPLMLK